MRTASVLLVLLTAISGSSANAQPVRLSLSAGPVAYNADNTVYGGVGRVTLSRAWRTFDLSAHASSGPLSRPEPCTDACAGRNDVRFVTDFGVSLSRTVGRFSLGAGPTVAHRLYQRGGTFDFGIAGSVTVHATSHVFVQLRHLAITGDSSAGATDLSLGIGL